jgi:hypothetical protein
MKKLVFNFILLFSLGSIFVGCNQNTKNIEGTLPGSTGSTGEILVVMDTSLYNNGETGRLVKEKLGKIYQILPQAEPIFDLINIPHFSFKKMFMRYRNVLYVDIDGKYTETKYKVYKDRYASPQTYIQAQAPNKKMMRTLLSKKGDAILDKFLEAERNNYLSTYKKMENKGVTKRLKDKFGISMVIPKGYSIDKDTTNFTWVAQEARHYSQNILVYEYPHEKTRTFLLGSIKERRNKFTQRYVPGPSPQSYVVIEDIVDPLYNQFELNGLKITEIRGLWKVENDFMGGPFINYSFYNPITEKAVSVDVFVYAPKYDKRKYLRQLEVMLHTIKAEK